MVDYKITYINETNESTTLKVKFFQGSFVTKVAEAGDPLHAEGEEYQEYERTDLITEREYILSPKPTKESLRLYLNSELVYFGTPIPEQSEV